MELNEKIKMLRLEKRISVEELAEILHVQGEEVKKWEDGTSKPEDNCLFKMSQLFDVSIDSFNDGEDVKKTFHRDLNRLTTSRFTLITVFLVLGCLITPFSVGGSISGATGTFSSLFLLLYLVTIPVCIGSIYRLKKSKGKEDLVGWGIAAIICLSFVGGILMVCTKEQDYEQVDIKNSHR